MKNSKERLYDTTEGDLKRLSGGMVDTPDLKSGAQ